MLDEEFTLQISVLIDMEDFTKLDLEERVKKAV